MVDQAAWFDVAPADFYGNGRMPNPDWGRFLLRSRWDAFPALDSGPLSHPTAQ
jgi:hypothetical protein